MTDLFLVCRQLQNISTHTLTWSVTRDAFIARLRQSISTHTLTWSVTTALQAADVASDNFNSHAHVERDNQVADAMIAAIISTHTLTWSVTKS